MLLKDLHTLNFVCSYYATSYSLQTMLSRTFLYMFLCAHVQEYLWVI